MVSSWASPDTTTLYTLLTTDSVGCTVTTTNLIVVDTATSLADGERRTFDLYPNPAWAQFQLTEPAEGVVRLFDLTGRLVRAYPARTTTYDVRALTAGSYLVEIDQDAGVLRRRLSVS